MYDGWVRRVTTGVGEVTYTLELMSPVCVPPGSGGVRYQRRTWRQLPAH